MASDMSDAKIGATANQLAEAAYAIEDYEGLRAQMMPLAEAGDVDAQAWMGAIYLNGLGVDTNEATALVWLRRAADNGHVGAQANVGAILLMGHEDCATEAIGYLEKAAAADDVHALFNLGVVYSGDKYASADKERAAACYRRAAECGHYPSQSRLGYMYASGQGVTKDRVQAYLWLTLAAQHGIGTALNALNSVVEAMSADEKQEGMRLFDEWRGRTAAFAGPSTIVPTPG